MVSRRKGNRSKKQYVRQQRQKKKEIKKMTEQDMGQNFQLKQLTKQVKSLTASEKAYAAFTTTSGNWQTIPTIIGISSDASLGGVTAVQITPIAIGTGVGDRTGASINIRHIDIDYSVRPDALAHSGDNGLTYACRVMVVCFHKPNGVPGDASQSVIPSYHDLFAIQGPGSGMIASMLRLQYQPFSTNYKVYYDRIHSFGINSINSTVTPGSAVQRKKLRIKPTKKNATVTFNTTSGAMTDILENMWVMIAMSDNQSIGNAGPMQIIVRGLTVFDQ